ncbi:MAG TPA: hypothetical protein DCR43_06135 [Bacteroidales bacterium]|nr:MAG: hypothetical protein A2X11_08605 [Bacteroidetes bacterium GWE2_42_24]OFY31845.1 MAG: hypothetical protein A2X09_09700 [Bacteroidetes bacterium GWF2_43_11]HAQ65413.1 hypothetical protein [Bacteroidales bacterium]HBZ66482.1 hypothetical protein [Bacteroidales bacterium]
MSDTKARKKKSGKGFAGAMRTVVRLGNIVAVVLLLLSYSAAYVNPSKFWWLAFLGLGYPVLLLINLGFVVYWAVLRRKFAFISLISILLGWNMLWSHFQFSGKSDEVYSPHAIRVLTYNVRHLSGSVSETTNGKAGDVAKLVGGRKADVVVMQEFYSGAATFESKIAMFLKSTGLTYYTWRNYFPSRSKNRGSFCMVTLSRFPIVSSSEVDYGNRRVALITDLLVSGDTIRLINVHLKSNQLNQDELNLVDFDLQHNSDSESVKKGSKKIYWKLRKAFIDRARDAGEVARAIKSSRYPVIVSGDFNDTPASYTARTILKGLNDAFVEAGSGYGNTYAGNLPPIRIDYLAASPEFEIEQYAVIREKHSDHYPVTATFVLLHER